MMREQLVALFNQLLADTIQWAPRLMVMIVLIVLGFAIAWTGERVLAAAMSRLKLDTLLARSGIDQALKRMGVSTSIDAVLPRIAFYLILILFARAAADVLGLPAISDAIATALAYVPNVAAAVLILMIGSALAQFAGGAVRSAAENSGIQFAAVMGSATSAFILFVLATMAITQLRVDTQMVQLAAAAVLAGLALGFGLAFGLGSREVMKGVLAGFYARQLLRVGQELEVGDKRGTLVSITPTQLLIETETDLVTVPNALHLELGGRQPR